MKNPAHAHLQYLSEDNASAAEQRQAALRQVARDFQRFEGDTGSSEVQGEHVFNSKLGRTRSRVSFSVRTGQLAALVMRGHYNKSTSRSCFIHKTPEVVDVLL